MSKRVEQRVRSLLGNYATMAEYAPGPRPQWSDIVRDLQWALGRDRTYVAPAEFNRCGEWVTHVSQDGPGWRHTDNEECPVCRGEIPSAVMALRPKQPTPAATVPATQEPEAAVDAEVEVGE